MTPIHEDIWGRIAGGNGMVGRPANSLPVEGPIAARSDAVLETAGYVLPVDPKSLGKPLPSDPVVPLPVL